MVIDSAGNTGTATATVTIVDTPPVVTAPADIEVEAEGHDGTPKSNPLIAAFLAGALAFDLVKKQLRVTNAHLCNIDFFFRRLIAYSLPVLGVVSYFLYIAKDTDWFEDPMLTQTLYVSLEYVIAITCFLYCATLQRYLQPQQL